MFKLFFIFVFTTGLYSQEFDWIYFNQSNSPIGGWITDISVDDYGRKWIGTYGDGIAVLQDCTWTIFDTTGLYLPSNLVWCIAIDGEDNKWVGCGTNNGGLVKINSDERFIYNSLNSGLPNNHVHSLAIDNSENFWIGTLFGGISKFDGTNWTNFQTNNSDIPANEILCIAIDMENNKWIGTWYDGFAKYDDSEWTIYNTDNCPLPHNTVIDIEIDSQNIKWIATEGGGLVKYDDTTWTVYDTSNSGLQSNDLISIDLDSNDNLWIGTTFGGLAFFDKYKWIIFDQNNGLNDESAICVEFDNLDVWIGTWGNGISVLKNGVNLVTFFINDNVEKNYKLLLTQNYPNPFNPVTKIKFSLPAVSEGLNVETHGHASVQLIVYDILGNEVAVLVNEPKQPGIYEVEFDASKLSSGVYFYRINAGSFADVKKMLLLK